MTLSQVLVGRGEKIPETPAGPVLVCTRNDDLDGVVEATPAHRRGGNFHCVSQLCPLLYLSVA